MRLDDYLERIGLAGPPDQERTPTLATLQAVHRAQAHAIPYEGLDIQQGVPLDLDPERIFDKLVTRRRGGWCYETNGLLGWALGQLGFEVRRCVAGVYRRERGDAALGNHLTLIAFLDQPWLCDLGLGDGLRGPIPLTEGLHHDGKLSFRLERLPDGYWRFHNHPLGAPETFDFSETPADEAIFLRQNAYLQSDPGSHFVQNAEVILMGKDDSLTLLGRVLRRTTPEGVEKQRIDTAEALETLLSAHFGIKDVDISRLWPRILARHRELFGEDQQGSCDSAAP